MYYETLPWIRKNHKNKKNRKGRTINTYGRRFYCTENLSPAKAWAGRNNLISEKAGKKQYYYLGNGNKAMLIYALKREVRTTPSGRVKMVLLYQELKEKSNSKQFCG